MENDKPVTLMDIAVSKEARKRVDWRRFWLWVMFVGGLIAMQGAMWVGANGNFFAFVLGELIVAGVWVRLDQDYKKKTARGLNK